MESILAAIAFFGVACVSLLVWLSIDVVCPYDKLRLLDESGAPTVTVFPSESTVASLASNLKLGITAMLLLLLANARLSF